MAAAADDAGVADAAEAYRAGIEATLGREMRAGRIMLAAFARHPKVFHTAVTMIPKAWGAFERIVRGDRTLADYVERRPIRRALDRLAR
ncbi:MAG: hypothetical protein HOU01_02865 [Streptomycetaceae bacterium]|nr:hypothetical protein [Streptomycetaceae bacterium]